jgi:predicted amidophosphoribosyltransferase
LLAVVVPPACVACRAPVVRAELRLCSSCTRALPWLSPHGCRRCGLPVHRRGCPASGAAFARAWAPLAYDGVARQLVAALKFRGALPVAALMAAHVAANLPADVRDGAPAALVPVPPQAGRRRRRGFDPAAELAAARAGSWRTRAYRSSSSSLHRVAGPVPARISVRTSRGLAVSARGPRTGAASSTW